jgi:hypothetical protein
VILGIFLVAFWLRRITGNAVFYAAVVSEIMIITIYYMDIISFLWLNVIGALLVIILSASAQVFLKKQDRVHHL